MNTCCDYLKIFSKISHIADSYPSVLDATQNWTNNVLNHRRREIVDINAMDETKIYNCLRTSPTTLLKDIAKKFFTDLGDTLINYTNNSLLVVIRKPEPIDKNEFDAKIRASFHQRVRRLNMAFVDIDRRLKKCGPFACNETRFKKMFDEVREAMMAMQQSMIGYFTRKTFDEGKNTEKFLDATDFEKELRDFELEALVLYDTCKALPAKIPCEKTLWGI